ncbi:hypothetical protein [Methanobacterium sp.]|uniref:hypothetical protein n=1 Tax=Methanobacterium sp. TaxID=2164 RepID=UPI003C72706E
MFRKNLLNGPKSRRKSSILGHEERSSSAPNTNVRVPQKSMIFEGFKKLFNRENRTEKDIYSMFKDVCENYNIEMPYMDRVVGKPIKAAGRTIYPIIDIATVGNNMPNFRGIEIFPIVLVIEESGEKYAISLTEEEIDSDEFIDMVFKKSKEQ